MLEPVTFEDSPFVQRRVSSPTRRILIVDDDDGILQSLSQLLRLTFQECKVATAATAEEAITMLKVAPVDLVITDLKLPTIDGLELVKRLRALSTTTRFILMTAYGGEEVMQSAHDSGCIAYLEKPFDIDLLLKYVEVAIHPYNDLRVELTGLSVFDVVELYVRRSQDVVLNITGEGSSGLVVVENSLVTHAQFDSIEGMDAFRQIINCKVGLVTALPYRPPYHSTLTLGLKELTQLQPGPVSQLLVGNFSASVQQSKKQRKTPGRSGMNINSPDILRKQVMLSDPSAASTPESTEAEQLELHSQPDEVVMIKEAQVKKLVQDGIAHFKAQNFEEASYCWMKALRLDPDCVAAKKNLQLLERTVPDTDPVQ